MRTPARVYNILLGDPGRAGGWLGRRAAAGQVGGWLGRWAAAGQVGGDLVRRAAAGWVGSWAKKNKPMQAGGLHGLLSLFCGGWVGGLAVALHPFGAGLEDVPL